MYIANGDCTYEMAAKKYDVPVDEVKKCFRKWNRTKQSWIPLIKRSKKKFDDREDGDIDNDGDEDGPDKYLHMRRKAIPSS